MRLLSIFSFLSSAIQRRTSEESRARCFEAEEKHGGLLIGAEPGGGFEADAESFGYGLCE